MIYSHIICLGDSLTTGARNPYGRSYPMELEDWLWEQTEQVFVCHQAGVNGETSADIRRRALAEMERYPEARELVLLCGTNDAKDSIATPRPVYRRNVFGILRLAMLKGVAVYLCTIPRLNGYTAQPYSHRANARIDGYNEQITALAAGPWAQGQSPGGMIRGLVDLAGLEPDARADGVHLTAAGDQEVGRRVAKTILRARSMGRT